MWRRVSVAFDRGFEGKVPLVDGEFIQGTAYCHYRHFAPVPANVYLAVAVLGQRSSPRSRTYIDATGADLRMESNIDYIPFQHREGDVFLPLVTPGRLFHSFQRAIEFLGRDLCAHRDPVASSSVDRLNHKMLLILTYSCELCGIDLVSPRLGINLFETAGSNVVENRFLMEIEFDHFFHVRIKSFVCVEIEAGRVVRGNFALEDGIYHARNHGLAVQAVYLGIGVLKGFLEPGRIDDSRIGIGFRGFVEDLALLRAQTRVQQITGSIE